MEKIIVKRGDTWAPSIVATNPDTGAVQSLAGWQIASQIRSARGALIAPLTVTNRNDAAGLFTLAAPGTHPTTGWPVGDHLWDIEYTDPAGHVASTVTIAVAIEMDVTHP
jgi:hypothetical protein